jgi:membrane protease YdiL (CAAX protease family)
MSDQATKNPAIRQGWLRALLFLASFCVLTLLITIPVVISVAGVTADQLKQQLLPTLEGLLTGNYLWLMILLELAISVISVVIFRLWIDRRGLQGTRWSPDGFLGEAVTGLFLGPAILGLAALLMLASGHLEWVDLAWDPSSLFVSLGLTALIAFSEELVFRGYVLDSLMDSFPNKWVALSISAVVFAAFHFTSPGIYALGFVNLVFAGFLLGINYVYTKNLWFSFFLHLSWNFFQGPILGFRVSGLTLPSLLQTDTKGDLFITGGDFGLEGSILTTVVTVIAFFVIAWAFERKYNSPEPGVADPRQTPKPQRTMTPPPAAKAQ